jgi:exopolysaccharide production protein ExoF
MRLSSSALAEAIMRLVLPERNVLNRMSLSADNATRRSVAAFSAAVALLLILITLVVPKAAAADDYTLDAMDKLRIRVVEWQTAEGAVRDWSSLSGDYVVGPSGNVSLPFIGELQATGKTTSEIAEAIGQGLQQKFGLVDQPEASVEVAEFRPIFVAGDVTTPGKYPFAPGLTVLKAVSLAGGIRRGEVGQRIERDFINARGNYDVMLSQRNSLLAKRARLLAEAAGKEEIAVPKELENARDKDALMGDERAFKAAREKRLKDQLDALDDLKALLQSEIASLEKKVATQNRQIELSREELAGIGKLAERGLVQSQRVLTLERTTADLESRVLDMSTDILRAKQDINKANQDAANLQSERDTGIAQERQQAEADIAQLNLKIGMYRDLMSEAISVAPMAAIRPEEGNVNVAYSVVRTADGKAAETTVDENAPIFPGDVVKIRIEGIPVR